MHLGVPAMYLSMVSAICMLMYMDIKMSYLLLPFPQVELIHVKSTLSRPFMCLFMPLLL